MLTAEAYNRVISDVIIEKVNERLKSKLEIRSITDDGIVCFDDKTKRMVVIVGSRNNHKFFVRGVLKKSRQNSPMYYSFNGQPGKNCIPYPKSGQGEEWCVIELPKYVCVHGEYFTPDEIECVQVDESRREKLTDQFKSNIVLKSGRIIQTEVSASHFVKEIAACMG